MPSRTGFENVWSSKWRRADAVTQEAALRHAGRGHARLHAGTVQQLLMTITDHGTVAGASAFRPGIRPVTRRHRSAIRPHTRDSAASSNSE